MLEMTVGGLWGEPKELLLCAATYCCLLAKGKWQMAKRGEVLLWLPKFGSN